jgi:hypothetical protein
MEEHCVLCEVETDCSCINNLYEFRFHRKNQNWHKVCQASVIWHLNGIACWQTVSIRVIQLHYLSDHKINKRVEKSCKRITY